MSVSVAREFDALDRVTLVDYPVDALDKDYDYNTATVSSPTPPDQRYCGAYSNAPEKGPSMDACNIVPGSDGREDQIMDCCRFLKRHSPWLYVPPLNDCQTGTAKALACAGLRKQKPGVPGDRFGLPCDQCNIWQPPLNPCPPSAAGRLRGMTTPTCQP